MNLVGDRNFQQRGDLQISILENIGRIALTPPGLDGTVACADQFHDLRAEQPHHGRDPAIHRPGGSGVIDLEGVEHRNHVFRGIPGLAGHPAVHREEPEGQALGGHGDRNQMAQALIVVDRQIARRHRRGLHAGRHAARPQESMEMSVLAVETLIARMRMIVVLSVGFSIVDIARRVVVPLVEGIGPAQQLANDVIARLRQHAIDFDNLASGFRHHLQGIAGQRRQLRADGATGLGQCGNGG